MLTTRGVPAYRVQMDPTAENTLLLEIAHCPVCIADPASSHPCSKIVRTQKSNLLDQHQTPEPWLGDLVNAPLLFISSNPGISLTEYYPRWSWSNDDIVSYFNGRFAKWIREGINYRNQDGAFTYVQYWAKIRSRARELYNRDVIPGRDYALMEIVHCKSPSEQDGVEDALETCANRYLHRILLLSKSRVIVIIGKLAKLCFKDKYGLANAAFASYNPAYIAGRERFTLFIAHPNARRSQDPRTFKAEIFAPFLPRLRETLTDT